jgi:Na+-transporting NADH:ubiquinone oxidoreductase subunit A
LVRSTIKIKRGLNIPLAGKAKETITNDTTSATYAVKPVDFNNIHPKLAVKQGDRVQAGTTLFFDKNKPDIRFTAPVSGTVSTIHRGERRVILEVVVEADNKNRYYDFGKTNIDQANKVEIKDKLLQSGLWPVIKQRPYNTIASPEILPKAIFISGFHTAPLAPDMNILLEGEADAFQNGIYALQKISEAEIHVGLRADHTNPEAIEKAQSIKKHFFKGPHPAGNVGTHIHHINPVNKGDIVWTIHPQHVVMIGRLFRDGIYDVRKTIALTGSEVKETGYYKVISGCSLTNLIEQNIKPGRLRYISGNVLTGRKIAASGHLGFFDDQFTVIPEGDQPEFFGWAKPGLNKYSASKAFLSAFFPKKAYRMNTNLHGGRRAFVASGQYERVLPMDLYPVHLLKAILVEDIELMENLGIYEVVEEDLALCEFVCTSKTKVQSILRKGLDLMIKENA